jgi:hypothetical protein
LPFFQDMTTHDIDSIYAYLTAIPSAEEHRAVAAKGQVNDDFRPALRVAGVCDIKLEDFEEPDIVIVRGKGKRE